MALPNPMPLVLHLFGPLEAAVDGVALPAQERRAGERLLALLALRSGTPTPRKVLAGLLWPESDEARAQFYLRRTLLGLRRALSEASEVLLAPDSRTLGLDTARLECDLLRFDEALARRDWPAAVALYRGPLLEGWSDEWLLSERTRREQEFLHALEESAIGARSAREAIACLRRIVAVEPGRESAWRALLEAMAAAGDAGALLSAYRELRLYLRHEARIEPSPETRACFERLRTELRRRSRARTPLAAVTPPPRSLPSRLPAVRTPLIGRTQERKRLVELLQSERLVTLVGIGGVGKTRLALAALEEREQEVAGNVVWVDLSGVTSPQSVAGRVAETIGISEGTLPDALADLGEETILALDNCEQVLEDAALLADTLLSRCPGLTLLCTSREPLGVPGEIAYSLPTLAGSESVALFLDRARRTRPDWEARATDAPTIAAICRRLDDIPLAIELAASLLSAMTLEEIDARLDRRFELLRFGPRTLAARQQTLQAAIDWSWELLAPEERTLLARLSVFVGGATLAAIETIGLAPLGTLRALVRKSLVVHDPHRGRYRLLETVRAYAAEHLSDAEKDDVLRRHAAFFGTLAEDASSRRVGPTAGAALEALEADHDNLRQAHDTALQRDLTLALRLCRTLWTLWRERGYRTEGRARLTQTLVATEGLPERAAVLLGLGALCYELDDYPAAQGALAEAERLAESEADGITRAEASRLVGLLLWNQGEHEAARVRYEAALALFEQLDHPAGRAAALASLAHLHWNLGRLDEAVAFNHRSQTLWRSLGDEAGIAETGSNLGLIARAQGDYIAARRHLEEALLIRQRLGLRAGIASLTHHLGVVALLEGNLDEAHERLSEALTRWRELHDPSWQALTLNYLGLTWRDRGQLDMAERLLSEALELRRRHPSRRATAGLLFALGDIAWRQRRDDAACRYFAESAALRHELGLDSACAEALCGLAAAAARRGDPERARWATSIALGLSHEKIPPGGQSYFRTVTEEFGEIHSCADSAKQLTLLLKSLS